MKLLALIATILVCGYVSVGLALPPLSGVEFDLNKGNMVPKDQIGTQMVKSKIQSLRCVYDYSRQGGSVSTISLQSVDGAACSLPSKAIVLSAYIDIVTAASVATAASNATIAFSTGQTAGDIKATLINSGYSTAGILSTKLDWTAASAIKLTAARTPSMVIGSSVMIGGKFNVFIHYILSD